MACKPLMWWHSYKEQQHETILGRKDRGFFVMDKKQALVSAYLMGARARTHEDMMAAVHLSKVLEAALTHREVEECKLQAELELDPMREYHGLNG